MINLTHYIPPEHSHWQGRADSPEASCFFQIIRLLNLNNPIPLEHDHAFAFLGFSCDEGIRRNLGRLGAKEGPIAIRHTLGKLPIQRQHIICYDAGDIHCNDGDLEGAQQALAEAVNLLLQQGITPIVLGGGHEMAWGHYQGIEKKFPDADLGIINFDAHFDMRPLLSNNKGSSGTPFLQIALAQKKTKRHFDYNCIGIQSTGNIPSLFATAKEHDVKIIYADELQQDEKAKSMNFIQHVIDQNQILYVSLCLDVFSVAYAPGVSAPQPLGITPWQVIPLIRLLASSGKVVSYDLAELSPPLDIDYRTAKLAASLIHDIIHHHQFKGQH